MAQDNYQALVHSDLDEHVPEPDTQKVEHHQPIITALVSRGYPTRKPEHCQQDYGQDQAQSADGQNDQHPHPIEGDFCDGPKILPCDVYEVTGTDLLLTRWLVRGCAVYFDGCLVSNCMTHCCLICCSCGFVEP